MNDIYLVDESHISYLVQAQAIDKTGVLSGFLKNKIRNQRELGQILWDENAESVSGSKGEVILAPFFRGEALRLEFDFNPLQVYKSASCFEYQTCDSKAWEKGLPCQYIELLKRIAVRLIPEYDGLVWGAPRPKNNACQPA